MLSNNNLTGRKVSPVYRARAVETLATVTAYIPLLALSGLPILHLAATRS